MHYEGSIIVDDSDIREYDKKELNIIISHFSASRNEINPEAVVKEWILGGRINHKKKLSPYSDTDREIAYQQMINFGLKSLSETKLKLISESSRRMASLAKIFASQSDILLLEKPETGLNLNQRVLLSKNIKKHSGESGRIIILTSSDLNFIASTCDRIVILADNKIAETGTRQIITAELLKKYFQIEAIVTKNIFSGLPEIQIIEEY